MKLLTLIPGRDRWLLAVSVIASLVTGASSTVIVGIISDHLINPAPLDNLFYWRFLGLILVVILSQLLSRLLLIRLTARTAADLPIQLSRQILETPLRRLEQIGAPRLLAALTEDTTSINYGLNRFPSIITSVMVILGCLIYLCWLSPLALGLLVLLLTPAAVGYWMIYTRAVHKMELAREERDNAYRQYEALTSGIKELKMHSNRRAAFFDETMIPTAQSYMQRIVAGRSLHEVAGLTSHTLYFIFVFLLFALASVLPTDPQVLSGFALISLYLKSSLGNVMGAMSFISNSNIAMGKIEDLRLALADPIEHPTPRRSDPIISWQSLRLHDIVYQYNHDNGENSFTLGPLDMDLHPGELVFIIGGNGDGKTTLAKVLTGLYSPQSGEITLDDVPILYEAREEYRKNFSVLFSDHYLFDQFLGIADPDLDDQAQGYLRKLLLDRFVTVQGGRLSTTELSFGQRKRLALMSVYLEDRPIYIFDEWAAGQDPSFKEIFYQQLLPELKARGKLVIVISHDDQYYQLADRVVKLNFGRIESNIEATR